MAETLGYTDKLKDIPFARVRAERVCVRRCRCPYTPFADTERKKAGTAKPSLLGSLLDDYDCTGMRDAEHEYDLKVVGTVMLGGSSPSSESIRIRILEANATPRSAGFETVGCLFSFSLR